jgi:hypothetical protein
MRKVLAAVTVSLLALNDHAEKILIVGDSISCGPFGGELVKHLTDAGHQVKLYCSVSSAPGDWLTGKNVASSKSTVWPCETRKSGTSELSDCDGSTKIPKFETLLADYPADRVMIALGTNSLPDGPDRSYSKMLELIASTGHACNWIGPPHLQPQKAYDVTKKSVARKEAARKHLAVDEDALNSFYDSLNLKLAAVKGKGCKILDSRDATAPGTPGNETNEGLHATATAAKYRYDHMAVAIKDAVSGSSTKPSHGLPASGLR